MAVPALSPAPAFLDTNVLVRHLTGDPPAMAAAATRYLSSASILIVPDVIVAELCYVLESVYERPRAEVAGTLRSLLAMPAVQVLEQELLHRAVEIYEHDRLDFAEAYLVASAERSGIGAVVSFDRTIDRVATVRRIEPR
ncbi:MAG TPA: type II toxin-antitoxin system VapC family toxin [Candidatus Limnocylindrales bacterium]|nr:type II toxin-antitoxin system VapC family toxin [Candidatus Limnocylindrales bacterium]